MKVSDHAVRRYKQRLGQKSATKKRIIDKITKEIETNTKKKYYRNGHTHLETPKFTAVCYKDTVITILLPEEQYKGAG